MGIYRDMTGMVLFGFYSRTPQTRTPNRNRKWFELASARVNRGSGQWFESAGRIVKPNNVMSVSVDKFVKRKKTVNLNFKSRKKFPNNARQ